MGALHQVNAHYYAGSDGVTSGHPADKLGFAIGAGLKLNAPMIGQGDYLQAQVNYTEGALHISSRPRLELGQGDGAKRFGVLSDAVVSGIASGLTATDLKLTTAWNVNAAYEHFWNPQLADLLYGGYAAVSYSDAANAILLAWAMATAAAGRRQPPRRLRQRLEYLVARLAHPVECHQGLLHGLRRAVHEAGQRDRLLTA